MVPQAHAEIIRLTIAYTLVGAFVFTVALTCLSLVGWVRFSDRSQQRKLFYVLCVQLVTIAITFFGNILTYSPAEASTAVANEAADEQARKLMADIMEKGRKAREAYEAERLEAMARNRPPTFTFRIFSIPSGNRHGPPTLPSPSIESDLLRIAWQANQHFQTHNTGEVAATTLFEEDSALRNLAVSKLTDWSGLKIKKGQPIRVVCGDITYELGDFDRVTRRDIERMPQYGEYDQNAPPIPRGPFVNVRHLPLTGERPPVNPESLAR